MDGNDLKTQYSSAAVGWWGLTKHMTVCAAGGKKFGQLKAMQQEELDSINQVNDIDNNALLVSKWRKPR